MNSKLIIVLLIGMLIGSFLGGVLVTTTKAVELDYSHFEFYLANMEQYLSYMEQYLSEISEDTDNIETYAGKPLLNVVLIRDRVLENEK